MIDTWIAIETETASILDNYEIARLRSSSAGWCATAISSALHSYRRLLAQLNGTLARAP
jgi:hypothetical protein